jgi:hypothetical protein
MPNRRTLVPPRFLALAAVVVMTVQTGGQEPARSQTSSDSTVDRQARTAKPTQGPPVPRPPLPVAVVSGQTSTRSEAVYVRRLRGSTEQVLPVTAFRTAETVSFRRSGWVVRAAGQRRNSTSL